MLTGILNKSTCAECRICCGFDETDMWEAPTLSEKDMKKSLELKPDTKFVKCGKNTIYAMDCDDEGIYLCPMLTETGCMLKNEKPFDCSIWPFRVMNFNGKKVITLSPVCPTMYAKPVNELQEFLKKGLGKTIFDKARSNPLMIKEYIDDYPILMIEE